MYNKDVSRDKLIKVDDLNASVYARYIVVYYAEQHNAEESITSKTGHV